MTARCGYLYWPLLLFLLAAPVVQAGSKLLATGGVSGIEGQAGGGIVPWAVIGGYGDAGEWGGAIARTRVTTADFQLDVSALSIAFDNRIELSASRQELAVEPLDLTIGQDVLALKVRLGGDLLYTSVPQFSLGMQFKRNRDISIPTALGADTDNSIDLYLAGSKLWLNGFMGRNVFANLTLRLTEAHQTGLLGFADGHQLQAEFSAGAFLNRHWLVGMEYRQKPDRLDSVSEDDWVDFFVGWFPGKRFAAVLAWSDLGGIAGLPSQDGVYLSLQLNQ